MARYIDIAEDFGAAFDGVTDDTHAWQSAVSEWKATGREIVTPKGKSVVTDTVLFDNVETSHFSQGPRIVSDSGPLHSRIVGKGLIGKPVIKIDGRNPAVTTHPSYFAYTKIEGLGIEQVNCQNSDGIEYHATWHSRFDEVSMKSISGRGYFAKNPQFGGGTNVGDNNASAHVEFTNNRIEGCAGPAWSSDCSYGGITNHTFRHLYAVDNAHTFGQGQIDNDGALHLEMVMCSIAASNNINRPLVKVRGTNLVPDQLVVRGGEYGNASGTHFDVDCITGFSVMSIRQVRRKNETASRYGFLLRNATGTIRNFNFLDILLSVDNVVSDSAPFTWMKKTSAAPLQAVHFGYSPVLDNAPGVVPYEGF